MDLNGSFFEQDSAFEEVVLSTAPNVSLSAGEQDPILFIEEFVDGQLVLQDAHSVHLFEREERDAVLETKEVEQVFSSPERGPPGPPGPPGAGAARFIKALTGTVMVIPPDEHGLTGVSFWGARRVSSGREVSLLISISIGGTVTAESLIPMDGITLTLE